MRICVVPYVGTWIEITKSGKFTPLYDVVPYVGTWIEIGVLMMAPCASSPVVPYVGTWIEIF